MIAQAVVRRLRAQSRECTQIPPRYVGEGTRRRATARGAIRAAGGNERARFSRLRQIGVRSYLGEFVEVPASGQTTSGLGRASPQENLRCDCGDLGQGLAHERVAGAASSIACALRSAGRDRPGDSTKAPFREENHHVQN